MLGACVNGTSKPLGGLPISTENYLKKGGICPAMDFTRAYTRATVPSFYLSLFPEQTEIISPKHLMPLHSILYHHNIFIYFLPLTLFQITGIVTLTYSVYALFPSSGGSTTYRGR